MPREFLDDISELTPPQGTNQLADRGINAYVQCQRFLQDKAGGRVWTESAPAQLTPQEARKLTPNTQCRLVNLADQTTESIAEIYADRDGSVVSLGTGFAVSSNELLTNRHVIYKGDTLAMRIFEKQSDGSAKPTQVAVQLESIKGDLALLKVPDQIQLIPLPLGVSSALRPGDAVTALGFPKGSLESHLSPGTYVGTVPVAELSKDTEDHLRADQQMLSTSTGKVAEDLRKEIANDESAQRTLGWLSGFELVLNMQVSPGNSGGPLLDEQGRVVGVVNFRQGDDIAQAIPVEDVTAFIAQARGKSSSSTPHSIVQ